MSSTPVTMDRLPPAEPSRPRSYGRRRAAVLASVYLLMGLHIAHWKVAGKTLAPLELNEVMYTLELGIVTAGFIFMAAAVISVAVFGRFFCSWGCHILALEDLCAWLLAKIRIRPKPVRSRLLLLVPPAALFYMFIWPQVSRMLHGRPLPHLTIAGDADGWASFTTTDFWRNLPAPGIAILTFAICGFAIVYFLGSRSFCKYACPYGALFALADRVAPGRILVNGDCAKCGLCTAHCQSHIRVHEEVAAFGKVVSPSCLKDLDCVSICPENALRFGFARPAFFKSWTRSGRKRIPSDLSVGEELLAGAVFLGSLFIFRGLYGAVPFLLTLGLGGILAYAAVQAVRLWRSPNVRFNNFQLKLSGRITRSGVVFAIAAGLLACFAAHSAFIRYHEFAGHRTYDRVIRQVMSGRDDPAMRAGALEHLAACDRWGLRRHPLLDARMATLLLLADERSNAEVHLQRLRQRDPAATHELVAGVHAALGDYAAAIPEYEAALTIDPDLVKSRMDVAECLAGMGEIERAADHLRKAVEHAPDSVPARHKLSILLVRMGQDEEAIEQLRALADLVPDKAEVHHNLGLVLARVGKHADADAEFRRAEALRGRLP